MLSALLQPDPAQRPDAASARQLLQELATTATGDEGLETWRWPVGNAAPRRSRRRAVAIAGSCVVAVATVAGLLVFRPDVSTPAGRPRRSADG